MIFIISIVPKYTNKKDTKYNIQIDTSRNDLKWSDDSEISTRPTLEPLTKAVYAFVYSIFLMF